MGALKQTFGQFSDLFKSMPASQRLSLILVTALVMGGFGFLMYRGAATNGFVPISVGKTFSVEELIRAEETLLSQGKTDFERRGQRLLVPQDKVEEYNSLLLASGSLPQNWAEEWEKQYADIGPFANNKQMEARKEMARAKLASQMISSLPDISYANVVWDQEEKVRWPQRALSTATVSVQPKPGREIPESLVHSIRMAIAGMKANLQPEDVTVFDLGKQIAYRQTSEDDPLNDRLLQRINKLKEMYRREVDIAVDYIAGVRVALNVDVEKVKSSVRQIRTVQAKATPYMTTTQSNKRNLNQFAVQKEPGQNANGPMNLAGQQTPTRSEDGTDTKETTLMIPSYETLQEHIAGALPENVSLSIAIPESYYRVVAMESGEVTAESTEEEIRTAVAKYKPEVDIALMSRLAKIIPIPDGGKGEDYIDISSYIPTPRNDVVPSVPWTQTISYMITQWGSATALALFGFWAFWTLNKTVRSHSANNPPAFAEEEENSGEEEEDEELFDGDLLPDGDTKRVDHLQYLVKNDPEMTASIISGWIQQAK